MLIEIKRKNITENIDLIVIIILSIIHSLLVFSPWFNEECTLTIPSDLDMHYGNSWYLYDSLKKGFIPHWSDMYLSGYPILLIYPPLSRWIPALLGLIFGNFNFCFYFFCALVFAGVLIAVYLLVRELGFGKETAFFSVLVLASNQLLYSTISYWGQYPTLLGIFFSLLCITFYIKYLNGNKKQDFFLSFVFMCSCLLSHVYIFFILFVLFFIIFVLGILKSKNKTKRVITTLIMFLIILGVSSFYFYPFVKNMGLIKGPGGFSITPNVFYVKKAFFDSESDTYVTFMPLLLAVLGFIFGFKKIKKNMFSSVFLFFWILATFLLLSGFHILPYSTSLVQDRIFIFFLIPLFIFSGFVASQFRISIYLLSLVFSIIAHFKIFTDNNKITLSILTPKVYLFLLIGGCVYKLIVIFIPIIKQGFKTKTKKMDFYKKILFLAISVFFAVSFYFQFSAMDTRFWCLNIPPNTIGRLKNDGYGWWRGLGLLEGFSASLAKFGTKSIFCILAQALPHDYYASKAKQLTHPDLEMAEILNIKKIAIQIFTQNDIDLGNEISKIYGTPEKFTILRDKRPQDLYIWTTNITVEPTIQPKEINIISYKAVNPEHIIIRYDSTKSGNITIKQNYWHYWKAYLDEKEIPVYRGNYDFLTVNAPKGKHIIELKYDLTDYNIGIIISLVSIVLLFLFFKYYKKFI